MRLHTDTRLKYLAEYQLSFTQNGFPCPGWGDPYVFFCQGALCTTFWAARCAGRYLAGVRLASVPANSEVVFPQTGCGNRGKLLRKEQQGGGFSTSSRFREPLTVWRRSSACRRNIRPLAKLSKAVKVADTGNQGKAESKALSAVTVTLREDTESFKKTDGVFNKDTFS